MTYQIAILILVSISAIANTIILILDWRTEGNEHRRFIKKTNSVDTEDH